MDQKGPIFSKTERVILSIALGFGVVLILSLVFLFSPPKQPQNPPFFPQSQKIAQSATFIETISKLTSSQEILNYLKENFILEERKETLFLVPKEIFENKKGNSFELAILTSYILWYQRYNASIIKYKTENGNQYSVVVFRDKDLPKTIAFTFSGPILYHHGWSFEEMFEKEEERLGEKIKEYSLFYWSDAGKLLPEKEEWERRRE